MIYTLPALAYAYDALEPHIDARTMEIHHTKHHQTYITKLNEALTSAKYEGSADVNELIKHLENVPESIRTAVRNNGGGHANHSFFWKHLRAKGSEVAIGSLAQAINKTFGSFEAFKEKFSVTATSRFGSGWAWLCVKEDLSLAVCSTANQDSPLMKGFVDCCGTPVIGLDVWEHAYYLNYQNRRPDYINAFWKIVDWDAAEANYKAAL